MQKSLFLIVFFPFFLLQAQEIEISSNPYSDIFPLTLVLDAAKNSKEGLWRPDWPLEFPPDAFKVQSGEISGCRIEGEGISLSYRLSPEGIPKGRIEEFPFLLNGRMAQITFVYRGFSEITESEITESEITEIEEITESEITEIEEITVTFSASDEIWKFEFLEYLDQSPFLVRGFCLDSWYFIYFSWGVNEILESWYDEEGYLLGAYGFSLIDTGKNLKISEIRDFSNLNKYTSYFYDSRNLLSEALGPTGEYKVLFFKEDLPRYWERRPLSEFSFEDSGIIQNGIGNFYLQWDKNDLLLRIQGLEEGLSPLIDYRYEYKLDEMGNWIERRETRFIRDLGLLVPTPGITLSRVLEYY